MNSTHNPRVLPWLLLVALMAATIAVYWVGLRGPFLFDDAPNFNVIQSWLAGRQPLTNVLFGNDSWLTHRTLAMASFALNAAWFGYDPWGFKLFNLLLHLTCAIAAYGLLSRLLPRDSTLSAHAPLAAALIVGIWLLHPFNVSTVLYAVQRMTQIATLCCLLGLWLYVSVRSRQEQGQCRHGWLLLWIGIPLLTLLGITGKQNAAILPVLCLVLELTYFRGPREWPRPLRWFYGLLVLAPVLAAGIGLALRPDLLLNGYAEYPFSPLQRLLSEGRVLCDYLRMLLAPYAPGMGVYTDDYLPSTGLFAPPTTALAIGALLLVSVAAWRVRARCPALFAGWYFFLVAHGVESTILPIELYYEHRNYLPAFGVFLACAGLAAMVGRWMDARGLRSGRIGVAAMVALLAMLAFQTHGRARVWSNPLVLSESAARSHPDSARALVSNIGMTATLGDYAGARAKADSAIASTTNRQARAHVLLFRIWVDCHFTKQASLADLGAAVDSLPPHVDLTTIQMLRFARTPFEEGKCQGITLEQMAHAHASAVDKATAQSDDAWPKYFLRLKSARLYARADRWDLALVQARKAMRPTTPPPAMSFLVMALISNGRLDEARTVYKEAVSRAQPGNTEDAVAIERMVEMINAAGRGGARDNNVQE